MDNNFLNNLRNARDSENAEKERLSDINSRYMNAFNNATKNYQTYRSINGLGDITDQQAQDMIRGFIFKNGVQDGKWTEDEDYDYTDFQEYGANLLDDLFSGSESFDDYVKKNATSGQQGSYKRLKNMDQMSNSDKLKRYAGIDAIHTAMTPAGAAAGMAYGLGVGAGALYDAHNKKSLDAMFNEYADAQDNIYNNAFDLIENYDKYAESANQNKKEEKKEEEPSESAVDNGTNADVFSDDVTEGDVIEYTYKPGDTFGQVLVDLGLATDKGLWGSDGDVAFYDQQLWAQGAPDPVTGFIPVGTTIKLRKRK